MVGSHPLPVVDQQNSPQRWGGETKGFTPNFTLSKVTSIYIKVMIFRQVGFFQKMEFDSEFLERFHVTKMKQMEKMQKGNHATSHMNLLGAAVLKAWDMDFSSNLYRWYLRWYQDSKAKYIQTKSNKYLSKTFSNESKIQNFKLTWLMLRWFLATKEQSFPNKDSRVWRENRGKLQKQHKRIWISRFEVS